MGRFVLLATLGMALHADPAHALQLIDTAPNPHWRAGLERKAEQVLRQRVEKARMANELGCLRHCETLVAIFQRIRAVADMQVPGDAFHWELVITRSPHEDAYALPDGRIVISEAFIDREKLSEEEIAFVLAHEAAHVILTHEADTLDSVEAIVPYGVNHSVNGLYAALDFDMGLLLRLAPLMQEMEEEADRVGLMLAALAGYQRLEMLRALLPHARRVFERGEALRGRPTL